MTIRPERTGTHRTAYEANRRRIFKADIGLHRMKKGGSQCQKINVQRLPMMID